MARLGTYRAALYLGALLVLALLAIFAAPLLLDLALPVMQGASSPDRCVVVRQGCHGERVAINQQWETLSDFVHNRGACTLELRPIDALNYTAEWAAGRCRIDASLPAGCEAEYGPQMCAAMQNVLDTTYQD